VADDSLTGETRPAAERSRSERPAAKRGAFAALSLFVRQIIDELRKVVRPTRREWLTYTGVVIAFVVAIMIFVFGLDQGFSRLVFFVFAGTGS